jgi:hypothetical protein
MRVADFALRFDAEPDALCSEMALAFLRATGRVAGNIPRDEQRRLLAHLGPLRALDHCGRRLGFRLVRPDGAPVEGDAVLLRDAAVRGGYLCALIGDEGRAAFARAGDGLMVTTRFCVARVARFG